MSAPMPRARVLRILQHAVAEAHQAEDQGHGHADQQDAEQAAHRLVLEIFQNELGGHFLGLPSGRRGAGWPGGGRLADHLQGGAFRLVEHELIVRHAFVDVHLDDVDHHAVFVPRAVDLDMLGKRHVVVGLPLGVAGVGEDIAVVVEDQLARDAAG